MVLNDRVSLHAEGVVSIETDLSFRSIDGFDREREVLRLVTCAESNLNLHSIA